jgi:hypothetical protein
MIWRARLAKTLNQSQFADISRAPGRLTIGHGFAVARVEEFGYIAFGLFRLILRSVKLRITTHMVESLGRNGNGETQRTHLYHSLVLGLGCTPVFSPIRVRPSCQPIHPSIRSIVLSPSCQKSSEAPQGSGKRLESHGAKIIMRRSGGEVDQGSSG